MIKQLEKEGFVQRNTKEQFIFEKELAPNLFETVRSRITYDISDGKVKWELEYEDDKDGKKIFPKPLDRYELRVLLELQNDINKIKENLV